MYCNFCGRNFEAKEGFEEVQRGCHRLIRCETCVMNQREEEYDWVTELRSRGSRGSRGQAH